MKEEEKAHVVVEELHRVGREVHRQQLQEGNVLRDHVLIHEVQRCGDQVVDVVVREEENWK